MGLGKKAAGGSMGASGCLFVVFLIVLALIVFDMAFIYLSQRCIDLGPLECAADLLAADDAEEEEKETVTATGVISREVKGIKYDVTVTITFPLEGGAVKGAFSGDCDGSVKGDYAGKGGGISGSAAGSCSFILPASGTYSGGVNTSSKTVVVDINGSVAGVGGKGSLTLSY